MSPEQHQAARTLLDASSASFLEAIEPLTPLQWSARPGPGQWSPAQIAEHIVLTETALFRKVQAMLATPPDGDHGVESATDPAIVTRLTAALAGRQGRVEAPATLQPSGTWTPLEVCERFQAHRAQIHHFLQTNDQPLHHHTAPSPFFGTLNAFHWLLYAPLHTQRHVQQLHEALRDRL